MKVGSSKAQKIDVRIIAATNIKIHEAVKNGKFREDLFYRLNTVSIQIPALRKRRDDIQLLFKKFAADFADKYQTSPIRLSDEAIKILLEYTWPGNIRQLKNFVAQISVIEKERNLSPETLNKYIPQDLMNDKIPILFEDKGSSEFTEREILYKVLFDMKKDLTDLKKITYDLLGKDTKENIAKNAADYKVFEELQEDSNVMLLTKNRKDETINIEQNLSLFDQEKTLIVKALEKHKGKRKHAAKELGISERTLYRKIKEFDL